MRLATEGKVLVYSMCKALSLFLMDVVYVAVNKMVMVGMTVAVLIFEF